MSDRRKNKRRAPSAPTIVPRRLPSARARLRAVYRKLFVNYGAQEWWPGESQFEIMVGAVLTQNTSWTNVERAIANLKRAGSLTPEAIVAAPPQRLAAWLRPSGYFNVKARRVRALCEWLVAQGGISVIERWHTHRLRTALLDIPGIGPETADDILLYALHRPVFVIDAYSRRIFSRLRLIRGDEAYEHLRREFEAAMGPSAPRLNEYHALIVRHGKTVCRTRPLCANCCLAGICPSAMVRQATD